jgi:type VI secretion system secreted protein VgrG
MSDRLTQDNRWLQVYGPLAPDTLIATEITGREELSVPYLFHLDCVSKNMSLGPGELLGKNISVKIGNPEELRWFGGIIRAVEPGGVHARDLRNYRIEIVPPVWKLSLRRGMRIFQEKTALQIVKTILDEHEVSYAVSQVGTTPRTRTYCVQYRESDLDFVSRLLQEEGIFYFHKIEKNKQTLHLADRTAGYVSAGVVEFRPDDSKHGIRSWAPRFQQGHGKWTLHDYDFEEPATVKATEKSVVKLYKGTDEVYDYPGLFTKAADGKHYATTQIEAEEAGYSVISGESSEPEFAPGVKFKLGNYPLEDQKDKQFVLTAVSHTAVDHTGLVALGSGAEDYANSFTCIPADKIARPERFTPRPTVAGPHTAKVVGPQGEEIYTDKYGRVKVQFHWDREGKFDDKSSCWLRVGTNIAGKNWGMIHIPRIGQEVIVDFLEGNPDRPLIVGSVWNAANMPPYALPDNKTQSGFKSRSSPKGGTADFNELRFEDKKGKEQIYFHAQKDFERMVENDDKLTVGNDRSVTIKRDESYTIERDQKVKITRNQDTKIDGKHTVTVKNDQSYTVSKGNFSHKVSMGKATHQAMQSITLKVGSNSVKIDQKGVTISGMTVKITAQTQLKASGTMTDVSGSGMLKLSGGMVKIN